MSVHPLRGLILALTSILTGLSHFQGSSPHNYRGSWKKEERGGFKENLILLRVEE